MAKLSQLQHEFIRQLFGASQGNVKAAAKAVGVEDYSTLFTNELVEELKLRADREMALNIPRAVYVISKMINEEDGALFFNEKLHKVCADLLDRQGLAKQERPNSGATSIGLIFMPNKQELPPPPEAIEGELVKHQIPFDV